jgi:signal transduction histidine kinase
MRCVAAVALTRWFGALAALLMCLLCGAEGAAEETIGSAQTELLTNLFQLRHYAEQEKPVGHAFRIIADVCDADGEAGVLALRDTSGIEFIRLDFQGEKIEPGATVCLESKGSAFEPKRFGLVAVPKIVVNNDGNHPPLVESGEVFLRAGTLPITLRWFNASAGYSLNVEYEGPNLRRQPVPSSILSRAVIDSSRGRTNFSPGLDYRCYEGSWVSVSDFQRYRPTRTGVTTNFDLSVRTRNENVGLEFNGFISIPRDGVYTFHVTSDDGSRLFIGDSSVSVRVLSMHPVPAMMQKVPSTPVERSSRPWVTLEGTVTAAGFWREGGELHLRAGNDDIRVEVFESGDVTPGIAPHSEVLVTGIYEDVITEDGASVPGVLRVSSWKAVRLAPKSGNPATKSESKYTNTAPKASTVAALPPISTAAEIKALSPELARQEFPVSIRGVVTSFGSAYLGAVIQDSTRGVFVDLHNFAQRQPLQRGEFCQIEGVTGPGYFAPVIVAKRILHLGGGELPKPVRASWDQLVNGSLDTEYTEIDGVVTAVHNQRVALLTEGGKISLDLGGYQAETLCGYENALIRICGCAFANFDLATRKLETGSLRVNDAVLTVLEPAPSNPFGAPQKSIGELLLYDPKAAPFRRLKVSGQVTYGRAGECFLTDGTNGMHITTGKSNTFVIGESVEAVGFVRLGGPVVELKEAVMRKTGRAALSEPIKLAPDQLLLARYAGTLVQVDATLMNQWREGLEQVLELQSGFVAFRARMEGRPSISLPPIGSRMQLTGVYVPQGNGPSDRDVSRFDLLLSVPSGIRILAHPPWWTLKRVLVLAGILAGLLCLVLVWNKELQWKVEERGRQLKAEIGNRQRAELRHAAETERARIARDLHDELGTGLTEVSLLAGAGLGALRDPEKNYDRLRVIAEKARALVLGLDVIVWAIDPKRNSLQSFADYVGRYATELFSASGIVCRFSIPIECEPITLSEAERHCLFLAVKEALNNVIHHARATEVKLHMTQNENHLTIEISDNGCGFDLATARRGNGLTNLHDRLKALNGECHVESQVGTGTTVRFVVPLPGKSN